MQTAAFTPARACLLVRIFERPDDRRDSVRFEHNKYHTTVEGTVVQLGARFYVPRKNTSFPVVHVGDRVLLRSKNLQTVVIDDVPYKLAHSNDILGVVTTEETL